MHTATGHGLLNVVCGMKRLAAAPNTGHQVRDYRHTIPLLLTREYGLRLIQLHQVPVE